MEEKNKVVSIDEYERVVSTAKNKKYSLIKIGIASPEDIRSWSYGEVKKQETINYRTLKPEKDGLFCEVIFGPTKDYQCACGKGKRTPKSPNAKCDKCGVELTESKVRRERMGHIELASPVVHTWYLRNSPSKIALLLDKKSKDVEEIVYLASYIVVDPGSVEELTKDRIITEQEHARYQREYGASKFKALTGAEAIKKLLQELNLAEIAAQLRSDLKDAQKQKREKIIKRLDVVESFLKSDNRPEWMVMDVIPVLPPDLRPMVQLDGGRFATTDLIDLYRRILNRNNRLRKQFEQRAPSLMTKNEKRMLQEAVDALIDNGKRNRKTVVDKNRPLKSLSDLLRGKQGRFRQNLLGKRVDYSGRSVIVVGPDLKMYQCGIPREMALILFKPFIIHAITHREVENPDVNKISIKRAKEMIEEGNAVAMEELERIVVEHPILLNRAPTLHRLGIQAFEPKLVEGKAIRLHPLVTTAFNADFDGDQMAVHLPLSKEAQAEARLLMLASKNILAPKDGKPIVTPTQDMVLGNYYLTIVNPSDEREGRFFKDINEVEFAYENDQIHFHTRIILPVKSFYQSSFKPEYQDKYFVTTYGKIIFNSMFPHGHPFVNEANEDCLVNGPKSIFFISPKDEAFQAGLTVKEYVHALPEPHPFTKKFLSSVIAEVLKNYGLSETSKTLDKMKDLGFKYSTVSGITVAISDINVVDGKAEVLEESQATVNKLNKMHKRGIITSDERRRLVIDEWTKCKKILEDAVNKEFRNNYKTNHIYLMGDSGARGSVKNFVQLSGMRGLMAKPNGEDMDVPIRANFKEGLSMSEFFVSTHGARKGSTDTALKTAESGYLTRRLVDVSQEVVVKIDDCHTDKGMLVKSFINEDENKTSTSLIDMVSGYKLAEAIINPATGKPLLKIDAEITENNKQAIAELIDKGEVQRITIVEKGKPAMKFAKMDSSIFDRFNGLTTAMPIYNPLTNELIVASGKEITKEIASKLEEVAISFIYVNINSGVRGASYKMAKALLKPEEENVIVPLIDRINGRYANKPVFDPFSGEMIVQANEYISEIAAEKIKSKGITEVWIRTLLTCNCKNGVCKKCYGSDLSTGSEVETGEVVGVIAAQSIGEPGTQLTMRTFHSGGVAGGDITQGLPRIQELFEAREPKGKALITEIDGVITQIKEEKDNRWEIKVLNKTTNEEKTYLTDAKKKPIVVEKQQVKAGERLTAGLIHPKELLRVAAVEDVENYIIKEVQKVYRSQSVDIADKHVEIIVKQMLQKVRIINEGDTDLLPDSHISKNEFDEYLKACILQGKRPPVAQPLLLGITRASLKSDSFLSAASFQETTRVLTEAAIRGKIDYLEGLKENIIIGGLIPAGTGLINVEVEKVESNNEDE